MDQLHQRFFPEQNCRMCSDLPGFVEKWKKCRSDAGVAVDKLGRVVRKLSTVYTDW